VYVVNVGVQTETISVPALRGKAFTLHPVQAVASADARVRTGAKWNRERAAFEIPARSAAVYVLR
jgi:pullulanase